MTKEERIALLDDQLKLLAEKCKTADEDHIDSHISTMTRIFNEIRYAEKD